MTGANKKEFKPLARIDISEGDGYGIDELFTPECYKALGTLEKILIPNGLIKDRVHRIAENIRRDYPDQTVHLFYIGMDSAGLKSVKMENDIGHLNHLKDRHVIVVEDLVDTGNTMEALIPLLQSYGPASLKIATLLMKDKALEKSSFLDLLKYVGFCIPDEFIVGYGMDVMDKYRDLEHICTLNDYGKSLYK